jgi:hypothetical protein
MNMYLLIFDRDHPASVEVKEFRDRTVAIKRLIEAEQLRKENPTLEVVLLNAADEADLRRTHSRYFESIDELLEPA